MKLLGWLKAMLLTHSSALAEVFSGAVSVTWGAATFANSPGANIFSARWSLCIFSGLACFVGVEQILSVFLESRLLRSWAAFQMSVLWLAWSVLYAPAYLFLLVIVCFDFFVLNVCCYLSNRHRGNGIPG